MTLARQAAVQEHRFLQGLPESQIQTLAGLASEVTFEENDVVLVAGQHSSSFYLLVEGSVAVELRTHGFVVCVQALGPGDVFGWSALLDDQDTLFQVRAREKTKAIRLNGAGLKAACREDPRLAVEIFRRTLQMVAGRVKATEIRFAEMCGVRV